MNEIRNRVAESGLITIDMKSFIGLQERESIDIAQWLDQGLVLKEILFREFLNEEEWVKYQNKYVLDGFFSNNTPLIEHNNSKNQIIIKTYYRAMYDLDLFIYKKLSSKMIKSGYNHMKNFINKGETTINFSISNNKYNTKLYSYLFLFMFIYLLIKKI